MTRFRRVIEVVLSILVETFKFYPADDKVYWNLAPILYPSTDAAGNDGALPLVMERYRP